MNAEGRRESLARAQGFRFKNPISRPYAVTVPVPISLQSGPPAVYSGQGGSKDTAEK